jgi:hypothetical protein
LKRVEAWPTGKRIAILATDGRTTFVCRLDCRVLDLRELRIDPSDDSFGERLEARPGAIE